MKEKDDKELADDEGGRRSQRRSHLKGSVSEGKNEMAGNTRGSRASQKAMVAICREARAVA